MHYTPRQRQIDKRLQLNGFIINLVQEDQETYRAILGLNSQGLIKGPNKRLLILYIKLIKAESFLLIQLQTSKVKLARFLAKKKVLGFLINNYYYGAGRGDLKHLLLKYIVYLQSRNQWLQSSFRTLILEELLETRE